MFRAVLALLAVPMGCSEAACLDNPFATSSAMAGATAGATAVAPTVATLGDGEGKAFNLTQDNLRSDAGLVVRSIRQQAPDSPAELAAAVSKLIDVQAWADAQVYLDRLNKFVMNEKELYEFYQGRGAEFFYTLHSVDQLAPVSQQFARRVLGAARRYSMSRPRIEHLVATLANGDIYVRSNALNQIKRVGPKAYAAMLEVFADQTKSKSWPAVRGAIRRLDKDATAVLIAGASSGNLQIQAESYFALAKLDSAEAIDLIGGLYLSPKTSATVRGLAQSALERHYGGVVDRDQLIQRLFETASENLRGLRRNVRSDAKVSVWKYVEASKMFESKRVSTEIARRMRAASTARLLYEIDPLNAQNASLFFLATLESAKKQAGPGVPVAASDLLKTIGNPDAAQINQVLQEAIDRDLFMAAIGACELLKEVGDAGVLTSSRGYSPLVNAILTGERHLQSAALETIIKIDPRTAYPGSTYVVELAAFLAQTTGSTQTLVSHVSSPDARTFEGIAAGTGASIESARNGLDFFNRAVSRPDWKCLLLTDNLLRPNFGQVVQMLRADWRTRCLPIGVVISDEKNRRLAQRLAATDRLIRVIDLNYDSGIVNSQLSLFDGMTTTWEVSDADRVIHAAVAAQWLGKLASRPDDYRFCNVRKHEDSIYRLLYMTGQARQATEIAACLGTARSQRELVNFASQSGQELAARKAAAKAFADSVEKFGLLLTTDEIRLQYARYNGSETESKAVQTIFASMLNAIESKRNAATLKISSLIKK